MAAKRKKRLTGKELIQEGVTMTLYHAAQAYVEAHGGSLAVCGGVQIQRWPGERPLNWTLAIKCTGRPPSYESDRNADGRG